MGGAMEVFSKLCCVLIVFFCVAVKQGNGDLELFSTGDIVRALVDGGRRIASQPYRRAVLVMGNKGVGKTTLIQWITDDNCTLSSTENKEDQEAFTIINNSTIASQDCVLPELTIDKETQTAYYEVPSCGVSRKTEYDIVEKYFLNRLMKQVDRVKILLVVDYPSVRTKVKRDDLTLLLTRVTELINNSDEYFDGVGLVVTKVDNNDESVKEGFRQLLRDDEEIVANTKAFLQEFVDLSEGNTKTKNVSVANENIQERPIELFAALTLNDRENVALFRKPHRAGPLCKIRAIQREKIRILTMISKDLDNIPIFEDDFNYTLSDIAKVKLNALINATRMYLADNITTVANEIHSTFNQKYIAHITDTQIPMNLTDMKIQNIETTSQKINAILSKINIDLKIVQSLASNMKKEENIQDYIQLIRNTQLNINFNLFESVLSDISSLTNFLTFIEDTWNVKCKLNMSLIQQELEKTVNKLQQEIVFMNSGMEKLNIILENKIKLELNAVLTSLREQFEKHSEEYHDIQLILNNTKSLRDRLSYMLEVSNPKIKLQKFKEILELYNLDLSYQMYPYIETAKHQTHLLNELVHFLDDLKEYELWCIFMSKFYNTLTDYDIQNNTESRERCSDFIQTSAAYVGRKVEDTNIQFILQDCNTNLYSNSYNDIKNVTLNDHKVKLMENIINFTLINNNLTHTCSGEKLTVKGRFVKIKDVHTNFCSSNISHLQILASEKVYVDKDLDLTGRNIQLSIMSPMWVIVEDRKLFLDGSVGKPITTYKADEGNDGKPGNPGGNAGNFLGYGDTFTNGERLVISVNGGRGGDGQTGGTGKHGVDGVVPDLLKTTVPVEYKPGSVIPNYPNIDYWKSKNFTSFHNNKEACQNIPGYCRTYTVVGTPCTDGQDGGKGGVGGLGGAAGFVRLSFNAPFKIEAIQGREGDKGLSGRAGQSGSASALIWVQENWDTSSGSKKFVYDHYSTLYSKCKNGRTPTSMNFIGRREPSPKRLLSGHEQQAILNEYKTFLQSNLESTLNKSALMKSLQDLNHVFLY